jgi:hypothetical protein
MITDLLNRYPDAPKKTLARLLRKEHPEEFTSVEQARTAIRIYTGASGKEKTVPIKVDKRPPGTLKIPKGQHQTRRPLTITTPGKWLMCSDWHVPYHDERALEAALRYAVDAGCEHLYLNGDLIDFYKSSQWEKDPRKRNLDYELRTLWSILDMVAPMFKGRKIYKIGNHEDRYTRRVWQATPELAVLPRFDLDEVLEVKQRGFEVVHSKQHARMNGLHVFHGHELARGFIAPVNVARGLWLRTNSRSIAGHWHRASVHVETAGVGEKTYPCYSLGCLCNLTPEYAPVNKWTHGFAIVELGKGYSVANHIIDRGTVYAMGG